MKECCTGYMCPISNSCQKLYNGIDFMRDNELGVWIPHPVGRYSCKDYESIYPEQYPLIK